MNSNSSSTAPSANHILLTEVKKCKELSTLTINCLTAIKLTYLFEILRYPPKNLMPLRNFGKKGLAAVEGIFNRCGITTQQWESISTHPAWKTFEPEEKFCSSISSISQSTAWKELSQMISLVEEPEGVQTYDFICLNRSTGISKFSQVLENKNVAYSEKISTTIEREKMNALILKITRLVTDFYRSEADSLITTLLTT